jgi:hypothetical protein
MTCRRNRRSEDITTTPKKTTITINIYITFIFKLSLYECIILLELRLCMLAGERKIQNRLQFGNKGRTKEKGSTLSSINCTAYGKPLSLPTKFIIHLVWKLIIPPRVESLPFHYRLKSDHSTSCGKLTIPPRVESLPSSLCEHNSFYPPCVGIHFCFTNSNNTLIPIDLTQTHLDKKINLRHVITSNRHLSISIKTALLNDMETNPGTGEKLKIITMNCRWLGEIEKFRLLLNKAHDTMQKCKMIIMIQETMIINSRYLDVAWRGKYVFTPGTGNNQNCITLMHNDVTITDIEHIQNRGHHFKIIEAENKLTLIVNIYALLGYNNEKLTFSTV